MALDHSFFNMNNRTYLITRSSYAGTGQFASHSLGENDSTFESMKKSITGIMLANMFGMPLSGAPICGYNGNTTALLCTRWHYVGAFQPLSWNQNSKDSALQDPMAFEHIKVPGMTNQTYMDLMSDAI